MTTEPFDRRLSSWMAEDAAGRVPNHLAEVLVATRATRQRPSGSSPERWLPVDITFRPVPFVFGRGPRLSIIIALLVATAVVTYLLAGAWQTRVPAPFGPARNGALASWAGGDIYLAEPDGTAPRLLIGGPTFDIAPWFSRDGTKLVFLRDAGLSATLMLAAQDGSGVRAITDPLNGLDWFEWSPGDDAVAIVHTESGRRVLSIVDPTGVTPMRTLDLPFDVDNAVYWRPPDGRELILTGRGGDTEAFPSVYAVTRDGVVRRLAGPAQHENSFQDLVLAPDGRTAWYGAFESQSDIEPGTEAARLYRLDLDTGVSTAQHFGPGQDELGFDVSPDGRSVAFVTDCVGSHCTGTAPAQVMVAPLDGRATYAVGEHFQFSGTPVLEWSPDGTMLAMVMPDRTSWLLPADAPGLMTRLESEFAGWQRLAP